MVKKLVLLAVLALALPLAAFADSSFGLTNKGGTLSGGPGGLTLSGSVIKIFDDSIGSNLGSVTFTTGAFISGDAQTGGTLGPGGTFTVIGNGTNGVPNGVIFSGTFSSALWIKTDHTNGTQTTYTYELIGALVSTNGEVGTTTDLTISTGKNLFNGSVKVYGGVTNVSVPEPGTLGLFGTGVLSLAGIIRRKLSLT